MVDNKQSDPDAGFELWLQSVYDINSLSQDDLKGWYDVYQYKGFNRSKVLRQLRVLVNDPKEVMQIVLICALRGPRRASKTQLVSGKTIESYRIPASGMKGTDGVSCQRISAATADLAAYFLKKLNVPKRLDIACPGWLQFPAAGSILLPMELRNQHIEFSKQFSSVIGGVFNEPIYQQMMLNSYCDKKLKLFDEPNIIITTESPKTTTSTPSSSSSSSSSASKRT